MKPADAIIANMLERDIRYEFRKFGLPDYMLDGLLRFVLHGIHPSNFLYAVLTNNLREAVRTADENNERRLVQWAKFVHCAIPGPCHGSPDAVRRWVQKHAKERLEREL